MDIIQHYQERFEQTRQEEFTINGILDICKKDPSAYASASSDYFGYR